MKKFILILIGILALLPVFVFAIPVPVPSAPTSGYVPVSTTTGAYQAFLGNAAFGPVLLDASGNITATVIPRLDYLAHLSTIVLQQGEFAFATDTKQLFIGDGTTAGGLFVSPWVASGNNIYYNTGNVGIGTTTPFGALSITPLSGGTNGLVIKEHSSFTSNLINSYDSSGNQLFYIDASGNPTAPAAYNLSTGSTFARNCFGAADCVGQTGADGFIGLVWDPTESAQRLSFYENGNEQGALDTSGNFQVNGSINAANFATLTTATSTFAGGINMTHGCYAINGSCVGGSGGGSGTVTSVATNNGLTGGTITTTGTIGLNTSGFSTNGLLTWNGSNIVATGTPLLTVGNLISTTTTASSFAGAVGVGSTSPFALLSVQGSSNIPQLIVQANSTQTSDLFDVIKSNGTKAVIFGNTNTFNKNNIGIYDFNQAGYTVGSQSSTNYDYGGIVEIHAADDTGFLAKLYNVTFSPTIPVFDYFADNSGNMIQSSETGTMSLATGGYVSPRLTIAANGNTQIGFVNKTIDTGNVWTLPANTLTVTQIGSVNPFAVQSSTGASLVQVLNGGNVGIGTSTPYSMLSVAGQVVGQNFVATSTTATSTFSNGINLNNKGCYAVNSICLTPSPWFDSSGFIQNSGNSGLAFSSPGSVRFDTTNNVDIGDVSGNADSTVIHLQTDEIDLNNGFVHINQGLEVDTVAGIGTTTPVSGFAVQSNSSTGNAFIVATTTGKTIYGIDNDGHQFTSGPAPVISSCGTGTGTVVGDDQSGTITTATAATACTMTFAKAYKNTPTCTVTDNSLVGFADISSVSVSAVTFGISSALTGGSLYYSCQYHR